MPNFECVRHVIEPFEGQRPPVHAHIVGFFPLSLLFAFVSKWPPPVLHTEE